VIFWPLAFGQRFKLEKEAKTETEKMQHLFASSLKRWPKARKSPTA